MNIVKRPAYLLSLIAVSACATACGASTTQSASTVPTGGAQQAQKPVLSRSASELIVGAWKLSRLDNVKPEDLPPWGPAAIIYVFWSDGRSKHYLPGQSRDNVTYGRGNTPFKDFVPYKIEGDRLRGWLGLTNDFDPAQTLSFAHEDQLLISYQDGSVATLERISADPEHYDDPQLPCAGLTVSEGYNPEFVSYLRRAALTPPDGKLAHALVGQWRLPKEAMAVRSVELRDGKEIQHPTPQELAAQPQIDLIINSDGTLGVSEGGVRDVEITGRYELRGDVIMQHTEECGAWARAKVEDGVLKLTSDGKVWQSFPKAP